jgi:DNA-binding IclR family transcriptional regulator
MIRSFRRWRAERENAIVAELATDSSRAAGWMTMNEIARKTGMTKFVVKRLLAGLEKRGRVASELVGSTVYYRLPYVPRKWTP